MKGPPTKLHKGTPVGSLYYDMKQMVMELAEQWAKDSFY